MFLDVAIVGGGPAGAYCAFELAEKGIYASIFDGSHPREKPCGGGISSQAVKRFPFLAKFRSQGGSSRNIKVISCTNQNTTLIKDQMGFNLSRRLLDEQLLEMATKKGAILNKENVLDIQKVEEHWRIKTEKQIAYAKVIVGADGVNSLLRRKVIGPISKENLGLTFGYLVTGVENEPTTIKFVAEIPGFIWIFPRKDHSSIGIGSQIVHGNLLKRILDSFISTYCNKVDVKSRFAAMLPWATQTEFFDLPCAGANWLLIGDAAGHVNPISGEGITYAFWSAKLAAEAIAENNPYHYDELWKEQYGKILKECCKRKNLHFNPLAIEYAITNFNYSGKTGELRLNIIS
jgi:geranylgeranyl reductase family protein